MEAVSKMMKHYGILDYGKLVAAFLVVAINTSPLTSLSGNADFFVTRILARLAVPFFFMVTGFFVLSSLFGESTKKDTQRVKKFLIRTIILYLVAIMIYLPVGWYAG